MVEIRQRRVMSQATESSELVAGLFPKAVRDRLYEEAKEKRDADNKKKHSVFKQGGAGHRDIAAMMESGDLVPDSRDIKSRPIADLCKYRRTWKRLYFSEISSYLIFARNLLSPCFVQSTTLL